MEDMDTQAKDFNWKMDDARARILQAILPEVIFDGWNDQAFRLAVSQSGVDQAHAQLAFPRGAIDVAAYMHLQGDAQMVTMLEERGHEIDGFSAKIEAAINWRLEIAGAHKEAVKAAASVFALPQNSGQSAKLIWHTADAIWTALGDRSQGFQYYSKRTSLSAVYSSAFLYWLQDNSLDMEPTREFVSRRIHDVGNFGKFTSKFKRKPA